MHFGRNRCYTFVNFKSVAAYSGLSARHERNYDDPGTNDEILCLLIGSKIEFGHTAVFDIFVAFSVRIRTI